MHDTYRRRQWDGAVLLNAWNKGRYDEDAQADFIKGYYNAPNRGRIEDASITNARKTATKQFASTAAPKKKKGCYT